MSAIKETLHDEIEKGQKEKNWEDLMSTRMDDYAKLKCLNTLYQLKSVLTEASKKLDVKNISEYQLCNQQGQIEAYNNSINEIDNAINDLLTKKD